jgi:AcrR family transcriptional regulator
MTSDPLDSPTPAKSYHHGDLRNALIAAGREMLIEEGVADLDLRKVARRVGVSRTAPYRHFADKRALLAAIAEDGFRDLTAAVQEGLDEADPSARARLTHLVAAYVRFGLAHPARMREMFSGLTIDRALYPELYAASKAAFAPLLRVITDGQTRGELRVMDVEAAAIACWSQMHGLTMLLLEQQIPDASEQVIDGLIQTCVDVLGNGLASWNSPGCV